MTRDSPDSDWTRRGFVGTIGAAAVATAPGISAAQSEETADALFEDPSLTDRAAIGPYFIRGLLGSLSTRARTLVDSGATTDIDTHVTAAVDEFETHREDWLSYVNSRGLAAEDRQSLALTFEYESERRERYVLADYNPDTEAYDAVSVKTAADVTPDVSATLRDAAVKNAADELATLHEEFIVPDKDVTRGYVSQLAGQYYFGSDHITASFLGGE